MQKFPIFRFLTFLGRFGQRGESYTGVKNRCLYPWIMRVPTVWRPADAPGAAPEPEFAQNSIFQSLSNLTSGGQMGNLYRDLQRFLDALENVQNRFSKKFFFRSNFSPKF